MADAEQPKTGPCTFLFKKSTKKFCGRKRKASDSDKGDVYFLCLERQRAGGFGSHVTMFYRGSWDLQLAPSLRRTIIN